MNSLRIVLLLAALVTATVVGGKIVLSPAESPEGIQAGRGPFEDFAVREVTDALTFYRGPQAGVLDDLFGFYFMDPATGTVEGWYDPTEQMVAGSVSGDNRILAYGRRGSTAENAGFPYNLLLADRWSETVYVIEGATDVMRSASRVDGGRMAGSPGYVLLRRFDAAGQAWFAVLALDPKPEIVATFAAKGDWGLISADGGRVAILGDELYVADLRAGTIEAAERRPPPYAWRGSTGNVLLSERRDRSGFVVTVSGQHIEESGAWLSYDWDGGLRADGAGAAFYLSPDASLVAAQSGTDDGPLKVTVFDTGTGATQFRVLGLAGFYGMANANRWLADNAGIVVSSSGHDRLIARRDGSVVEAPGVPSPVSPELFARHDGLVDSSGRPVGARLMLNVTDFVPPWADTDRELRARTPRLGHDCCGEGGTLLRPHVEEPPYTDPPRLYLRPEAAGLELWDSPGSTVTTGVVRELEIVAVHEWRELCVSGTRSHRDRCVTVQRAYYDQVAAIVLHGGYVDPAVSIAGSWARVTLRDGQEGWLLLAVTPQYL